ncbi:MAG: CoA-acylating methylmalonate-semialdehyde dehydrogenase [Bryobacteraceae bacterium]
MSNAAQVTNYVAGEWRRSQSAERLRVYNPARGILIAEVPVTTSEEVDEAVQAAVAQSRHWRAVPVTERIQFLFKFKNLLEENFADLTQTITDECGKTQAEAEGELRRGIENVEVSCGAPSLLQGYNNEDIASGIDEHMFRQPVGVAAAITPFNFPAMIPLWFLPHAVAYGNCFILKPSEKVPLTSMKLIGLLHKTGLPKGVVQLLNGSRETVDALLDHPGVRAISFVGSTAVARYVYSRATQNGKRAQCQGGAKNPIVVMPDADMEMTTRIAADSAFGCAGQRCLAASLAIAIGDARHSFTEAISEAAATRKVGYGSESGVQMGPVITAESKARIESIVEIARSQGAEVAVDGRNRPVPGYEDGYFLHPTVLRNVGATSDLARTEVFGPVLGLLEMETLEEAIEVINAAKYGNMACLFTRDGAAARKFRYEVNAGNIGINVGVAAPMAFFPFSGWKDSFFGDLHAQGRHSVEFYTETKVVVERWPSEWSRKF